MRGAVRRENGVYLRCVGQIFKTIPAHHLTHFFENIENKKEALDWRKVGIKHRRLILLQWWESVLVTFFITEEVYL